LIYSNCIILAGFIWILFNWIFSSQVGLGVESVVIERHHSCASPSSSKASGRSWLNSFFLTFNPIAHYIWRYYSYTAALLHQLITF